MATKITFERSGGLFGQTINVVLDLDSMPSNESQYLLHLVQKADFFRIPENLVTRPTADEFVYVITLQAGSARHQVRVSDTTMPEELEPLISELTALAASIKYFQET